MKRIEAKHINRFIREHDIITDDLFAFLDQEIDTILKEELQTEKVRVKRKIATLFNDNYIQASAFFMKTLETSY
ncbi:hypothetical protein AB832_03490 [Flavobacteriaceae bacterium (ex Bugula neritina AB1)]|nr:hypothetical protein AB832_03490 [Flavobacteriaceae bacterium (ex Bugula neritina AB1)]